MNKNPELMIGLVAPVGVDLDQVIIILTDYLKQFNYTTNQIVISSLIDKVAGLETKLCMEPEYDRINTYMSAGDEVREKTKRGYILAALAINTISFQRDADKPLPGTAHIFKSLKHPDEVHFLRDIYGEGFYLLSISSSRTNRLKYLARKNIPGPQAEKLIKRDESESGKFGQHMSDAFHLADGFIDIDSDNAEDQVARILDLIFGNPCVTPTKDEYAMFLAFAASMRSGDLSRQVGAVITSKHDEIIATGANDVPCFGGGLYWSDHGPNDQRDYVKGHDANECRRNEIVTKIMKKFRDGSGEQELLEEGKQLLKDTGILDITEYGRAVHAEMEALLSCGRSGASPRGGTLYCTTFPCHNCAKHIVASGINRVVFVEPYPKSLALDLHSDAICLAHESVVEIREKMETQKPKVCFEPFVGVGPRKFFDLFSMNLSRGNKLKRELKGKKISWKRQDACVRVPLSAVSYIEKEPHILREVDKLLGGSDGHN